MVFQVPKLGDDALRYVPGPAVFQQITADTLGNAASDTDGYDAEFQDLALLLAGESEGLSTMDADLQAAGFQAGQIAAQTLTPVADELAATIADAGASMDDFTAAIGGTVDVGPLPDTNAPPPVVVSPGDLGGFIAGGDGVPLPPTGPDQQPDIPTTPTPPAIPPEGPTGTLDASTGQTGTLPPGGAPVQEPADLPLGPSPFGPVDVAPPDTGGDVQEPADLPLGPSPFGPPDVLPPPDPGGSGSGGGGGGSGSDNGDGGDDTGFDFEDG
jgi:hypothetical protein